jgi:hypothetical protein
LRVQLVDNVGIEYKSLYNWMFMAIGNKKRKAGAYGCHAITQCNNVINSDRWVNRYTPAPELAYQLF